MPRALCTTSWKRWFCVSFSSTISSTEAGKSGNTSTEIIRNFERCTLARSQAIVKALKPPSDPSLATTICLNMSHLLPGRFNFRQEPLLRDYCWYHRAGDDGSKQNRVLLPVNDIIRQSVKCRDRAESKSGRHQQRRKHALTIIETIIVSQR